MVNNGSAWWFQPTPLKNDGVKVSWDDDIPKIWKVMKFMFQSPPTRIRNHPAANHANDHPFKRIRKGMEHLKTFFGYVGELKSSFIKGHPAGLFSS